MKNISQKFFRVWWLRYSKYVRDRIIVSIKQDEGDVVSWRELSFVRIVTFVIPITFAAFFFRIALGMLGHHLFYPFFDIIYYAFFCFVVLQKQIAIGIKKVFVICMFYLFSLTLLLLHGSQGPGILYLTGTFILTVFIYPSKKIYYSLLVNTVIACAITLIISYQLFPTPLIHQYTTFTWVNYSLNLLFVNLLCLMLIQRIIERLEKIIIKESELIGQLADETLEIANLNNKLKESEDYYRYLFASNPIPMWVFDTSTLYFLQVNDAAINLYGYTRQEFLSMTIQEIQPKSEIRRTLDIISTNKQTLLSFKGNMLHLKKNKDVFPVEVRSNPIEINGKTGRLVLATDITERSKYIKNIENQNKKLRDIAWIQSHKVRAPLARVMSLTDLLSRSQDAPDKDDIMKYLMISADELNEVICSVVKQAEENIEK